MRATDLTRGIWNGIADLVARNQAPREIYYLKVTKVNQTKKIIYCDSFGSIGIPLVSHEYGFFHYDTVPVSGTANLTTGAVAITSRKDKREDAKHVNPAFKTEIIVPKVGDLVVVLDPWGARRFPICIGTIQSKPGFWED